MNIVYRSQLWYSKGTERLMAEALFSVCACVCVCVRVHVCVCVCARVWEVQGKVFPKLRKRTSTARLVDQEGNGDDQIAADYVFRIVYPGHRHDSSELSALTHTHTQIPLQSLFE